MEVAVCGADDLVVIVESGKELIKKLHRWKNEVQNKGRKVHTNKTKVMISGESRKGSDNTGRWPCGVCGRDDGRNSVVY